MTIKGLPLEEMSTHGILWAINRHIFHPMGFALTFHVEEDGTVTGWTVQGTGTECWYFTQMQDDVEFQKFKSFMDELRQS